MSGYVWNGLAYTVYIRFYITDILYIFYIYIYITQSDNNNSNFKEGL